MIRKRPHLRNRTEDPPGCQPEHSFRSSNCPWGPSPTHPHSASCTALSTDSLGSTGQFQAREQGMTAPVCQARLQATTPASTLTLIHTVGLESVKPCLPAGSHRSVFSHPPGAAEHETHPRGRGCRASQARPSYGPVSGGQDRSLGPFPYPVPLDVALASCLCSCLEPVLLACHSD